MFQSSLDSPLGVITISSHDGLHVCDVAFATATQQHSCLVTEQTKQQLIEYFNNQRVTFDVPLLPSGTPFQRQVWQALLAIPFGETASYRDIAAAIDNPKGVRAVGMANSRNPIAIIVPCHRIIGANGSLVGYAGGLDKKEWLLRHEQAL